MVPKLLGQSVFWHSWWSLATLMVGTWTLLIGVAALLVTRGRARVVLASLFVGYVAYGLAFTYNYETAVYYHLPLVLPVSLGAGLVVGVLADRLKATGSSPRLVDLGAMTVVLVLMIASWVSGGVPFEVPAMSASGRAALVTGGRQVGELVHHDTRSILFGPGDGNPLRFYGLVAGANWLTDADRAYLSLLGRKVPTTSEEIADLSRQLGGAHYFIATDLGGLDGQPGVRQYLDDHYRLVASSPWFRIWDLRHLT